MAFFMLQKYPNIKKAVINDINPHLTTTYSVVRDKLDALLETLSDLNDQFTLARIQTSSI